MVFPIFRHTHMRLVLELLHNGSCAVLYFSRLEHGIPTGESLTAHKKMRFLGGSTGVIFRSPPISEKAPNLGTSSTPAASARSTASRRFSKGSLWASANGYSSGQKDTTCVPLPAAGSPKGPFGPQPMGIAAAKKIQLV